MGTTVTTTSTMGTTTTTTTPIPTTTNKCDVFHYNACDLLDESIIEFRHNLRLSQCQERCQAQKDCSFFTWVHEQEEQQGLCWLLRGCGDHQTCAGCISGPKYPDIDDC